MSWRWMAWTSGMLLVAVIALFPLRVAFAMSDLERIGFTARQVAGTIWYGRIGELHLRSQPLGTFEVQLDPAALLIGNISMRFSRLDSPEGLLEGQLVAGSRRGIKDSSGRIAVGEMFAPLPVDAVELQDVTLLFRNGQCAEASGRITPVVAPLGIGVNLASGLSGTVRCDGERARVVATSADGSGRVEFYVDAQGRYRAWMSIAGLPPEASAALGLLGFRSSPGGLTLSSRGRL